MNNNNVSYQDYTLLSLKELFENRYFVIPDFQRGYSWEEEHVNDLIADIENLYDKSNKHFTGTIVAVKMQNELDTFELVDGQQRLTTLVILLKQIFDINPELDNNLFNQFIQRGTSGNERCVFTSNEETKRFFEEVIILNKSCSPEIKSHEYILSAKNVLKKWLLKNIKDLLKIKTVVTERLGFILYTPENDKEIGIMFEVINNRGKQPSELEKIKNYFIYYATIFSYDKLRNTINALWYQLQRNLTQARAVSNDEENIFLRNCYIVFFEPNKSKSWDVYNELKKRFSVKISITDPERFQKNLSEIQKFIQFLKDASLHYAFFYNENYFLSTFKPEESKELLKDKLAYLRCQHANASIMPLYLAIMSRLDNLDKIEKVDKLLKLLEIANFRLYILPGILNRADSKQGDLFYYANEFYKKPDWLADGLTNHVGYNNEIIHKGDIFDWLELELTEMIKYLCPLRKMVEVLTLKDDENNRDFEYWHGIKYLLGCYELELRLNARKTFDIQKILAGRNDVQAKLNDHLSIEHIWAKKNRLEKYLSSHKEKRRLGNFVLMGLLANISLQNIDIPAKISELNNYNSNAGQGGLGMHQVAELTNILSNSKLGLNENDPEYFLKLAIRMNDERETKIIKEFVLNRWKLKNEPEIAFEKIDSFAANELKQPFNYFFKAE